MATNLLQDGHVVNAMYMDMQHGGLIAFFQTVYNLNVLQQNKYYDINTDFLFHYLHCYQI
jgi:hypothetical protein